MPYTLYLTLNFAVNRGYKMFDFAHYKGKRNRDRPSQIKYQALLKWNYEIENDPNIVCTYE
jgi:hypothetical protein